MVEKGRSAPTKCSCKQQAGTTLAFVAVALVALLGTMVFALDLGMLYVGRNEAQRAADAAALAGATAFQTTLCTTTPAGCQAGGPQEPAAIRLALAAAVHNAVLGQPAVVDCPQYTSGNGSCPGIIFSYPTPQEPQITVTVRRSGIPTFFARIFGTTTASVAASARAEAYNPTGGTAPTNQSCVRPFLVPNCDPNHPVSSAGNSPCPQMANGLYPGRFINPGSNPPSTATIQPNVPGEQLYLHFGNGPADSTVPSQWYMLAFGTSQSGSNLRSYIVQCYPLSCGDQVQTYNGKSVGPVDQGTEALINANGASPGCPSNCNFNQGQDTIEWKTDPWGDPYTIHAGANNPLVTAGLARSGDPIAPQSSPSVITVAVYDGQALTPGGSPVQVVGWMQLFVQGFSHQGQYDGVEAVILNVSLCGPGGSGPGITGSGGSTVPIRLIRQ